MQSVKPIRLGRQPLPPAETSWPANVVEGAPQTATRNYYTDPSGSFSAGLWESSPGKWRVHYSEAEFCTLLSGKVVLAGEDGSSETFAAGDAFVIPVGFNGTWETVEPCRKLYAIFEQPSAAPLKLGDSLAAGDARKSPAHR